MGEGTFHTERAFLFYLGAACVTTTLAVSRHVPSSHGVLVQQPPHRHYIARRRRRCGALSHRYRSSTTPWSILTTPSVIYFLCRQDGRTGAPVSTPSSLSSSRHPHFCLFVTVSDLLRVSK